MSRARGPVDPIRAAAQWFALLQSGAATEADRANWQEWKAAHPSHEKAWRLTEEVQLHVGQAPADIAEDVLNGVGHSRRRFLRATALAALAAPATFWLLRTEPVQVWMADYRTRTGERRGLRLPDGSSLTMNTATAVDLSFDRTQRRVVLREGELMLTSAPDPAAVHRPLSVATQHGVVTALGTRFSVRVSDQDTQVSVYEKAVRVEPVNGATAFEVQAGEQLRFDRQGGVARSALAATDAAWVDGRIVALDMSLGQLVAELSRYRSGTLRCASEVAGLRVSGVFSVANTDQALDAIARSFPVKVHRWGAWWVRVEPA
ncbi:FecR domain-containing protein [Dyella sp. 20L07]|uniref:FecR domain-containing protein n=1 Tax=Dyella sp. 20L07 TaxID=3384240 RepID=UPI003D2B0071